MSLSWALDKIPDLKGPEGVDQIKTFFKKFDSATEGISDVVRLKALESKIIGRAERAFNTALGNSPFIYSSVRREMLRILETTDTKEICAFDELMSGVKRRENENIDLLANRIASLVKRAYPGMTNNLLDEYSIKHLIRSIGDSNLALNLEIARQDGMSFDSFVSLAARAESTQKATRHTNFQSKPVQHSHNVIIILPLETKLPALTVENQDTSHAIASLVEIINICRKITWQLLLDLIEHF
uniref:Uncharacterized protein n=1 Tax=Meloidogyne enterolobii TaxID=390850 RepID=A0A6V7UE91_MELEN|nr:unnamed protein product [Meloidogyne enterolobii]